MVCSIFPSFPHLTACLLLQGVDVHLPVDAISSTHWEDRRIALERLSQCGAFLTTTESILFQLAKDARNASFKASHVAVVPAFEIGSIFAGYIRSRQGTAGPHP